MEDDRSETRDNLGFNLEDGAQLSGMSLPELWWRYVALGGESSPHALAAQIGGAAPVSRQEHNLIAQAINEGFLEAGTGDFPVAYVDSTELPVGTEGSGRPTALSRVEMRYRAAEARRRSAEASRQAAMLQLASAKLLRVGGRVAQAEGAASRARNALSRAARADAAGAVQTARRAAI